MNTLKQNSDSAIIYNRENPFQDATSEAMEIFKIVQSAKLPIKLVKNKGSNGAGESELDNESSYTNCLLVTLAKSLGSAAIIKSGIGVPDIKNITKNPN